MSAGSASNTDSSTSSGTTEDPGTAGTRSTTEPGDSTSETETTTTTTTDMTTTTDTTRTTGEPTTGTTSDGSTTEDVECPPDNLCCLLDEGQLPPHHLLDLFLDAYPPELMPTSAMAVKDFAPTTEEHMMAWSKLNVGNELIDAQNGGVIKENIATGRDLAREAAEMAIPPGSTILDTREDAIIIDILGDAPPCDGVGWGWGSILFENVDESVAEVVYLYIGYCESGDVEAFYFSEQSVEVCAAPG